MQATFLLIPHTYKKLPKLAVINIQPVSKSSSGKNIITSKTSTPTLRLSLHTQSLTSPNLHAQQNENHRRKRRALEISAASLLTLQLPLYKQSLPNYTQHTEPNKNR